MGVDLNHCKAILELSGTHSVSLSSSGTTGVAIYPFTTEADIVTCPAHSVAIGGDLRTPICFNFVVHLKLLSCRTPMKRSLEGFYPVHEIGIQDNNNVETKVRRDAGRKRSVLHSI